MKITYTPNPLETRVELDEHEKRELWYKIKLEQYEDMIFSAHYELTHGRKDCGSLKAKSDLEAIEAAAKELDPSYWCTDEKSDLDKRVDELLEYYLADLQGIHVGDCTCVPCSCTKCHAESLLGIDTIKGLGKHPGHKISAVFSRWNPDTKQHDRPEVPLEVALEKLRTYEPVNVTPGYESHIPRWTAEAKAAYEWLLNYRNTHFPKE